MSEMAWFRKDLKHGTEPGSQSLFVKAHARCSRGEERDSLSTGLRASQPAFKYCFIHRMQGAYPARCASRAAIVRMCTLSWMNGHPAA